MGLPHRCSLANTNTVASLLISQHKHPYSLANTNTVASLLISQHKHRCIPVLFLVRRVSMSHDFGGKNSHQILWTKQENGHPRCYQHQVQESVSVMACRYVRANGLAPLKAILIFELNSQSNDTSPSHAPETAC